MERKKLLERAQQLLAELPKEEQLRFAPILEQELEKERLREIRRELVTIIEMLKGKQPPREHKVNFNAMEKALALLIKKGEELVKQGIIALAPIFSFPPRIVLLSLGEEKKVVAVGEIIEFKTPLRIKLHPPKKWRVQFKDGRPRIICLAQAKNWIDEITREDSSPQATFLRRLFELPLSPSLREEDMKKLLFLKEEQMEEGK